MQPSQSENPHPDPSIRLDQSVGTRSLGAIKKVLSAIKGWHAIPAIIIGVYVFLGIFGPTLAPFEPNRGTISDRLCPPLAIDALTIAQNPTSRSTDCSAANILGTDQNGKDIFSRLLHGARSSLWVVGPSVLIGTFTGAVIGAVINNWRAKARLVAYLFASVTIVPVGIVLLAEPHTPYVFGAFNSAGDGVDWSAIAAFSCASGVITLAMVAVAFRFDPACRSTWVANVDSPFPIHSFRRNLFDQIVVLSPWIGVAGLASAALVFLRSGSTSLRTAAIRWSYEPDYLFEHIGMLSPVVPMILIPVAFLSFATLWIVRHVLGKFKSPSIHIPSSDRRVDDVPDDSLFGDPVQTEANPEHVEPRATEIEETEAPIDAAPTTEKRRTFLTVVAIVAAIVVVRFGVADVGPIVRELVQDPADAYNSAWSQSVQGRLEAIDCANELSSKLMTLRSLPPEQLEIEASQRCVELYFQQRNAPSHRWTIDYALQFVPQTLTLSLIGAIVSAALWNAFSASTRAVRVLVETCVFLVTLIGLTMTFGYAAWSLAVLQWFNPVNLVLYDTGIAISRTLNVVRDASVAIGISYLTIALVKPAIRFGKPVPRFEVLSNWTAFFIPCVLLTAGLLILFHYRFPVNLLFIDDSLGVITDPTPEQTYFSTGLPIRNWLWTYWFAAIGYAAIVFTFLYAAAARFSRYSSSGPRSDKIETPVSPDNPSQDGDPT